jgi:hypothetical protein
MNKVWSMLSVLSVLGYRICSAAPEDEVKAVLERFVAAQNAHDVRAVGASLLDAPPFSLDYPRHADLGTRGSAEAL